MFGLLSTGIRPQGLASTIETYHGNCRGTEPCLVTLYPLPSRVLCHGSYTAQYHPSGFHLRDSTGLCKTQAWERTRNAEDRRRSYGVVAWLRLVRPPRPRPPGAWWGLVVRSSPRRCHSRAPAATRVAGFPVFSHESPACTDVESARRRR